MGISIYPVPALRKCPPPGFARSFLAGFWTELEMRNPMHLRELVCKFFRNEISSIFTISSIVSSGEILRLVFHLFVSLRCWLKRFAGGLMWIQRLALHPSSVKNFQCDYFGAECPQRSGWSLRRCNTRKNKSLSFKIIFDVCNWQWHDLRVWKFLCASLLERSSQTEERGGLCSGGLRVSFPSVQTAGQLVSWSAGQPCRHNK